MSDIPYQFRSLRGFSITALTIDLVGSAGGLAYAVYAGFLGQTTLSLALAMTALLAIVVGILFYCQNVLLLKSVSNSYRSYDALLDMNDLLRKHGEYGRMVADNSALSDWAKRVIYREKDYEFLRDTIQGAIVREDWETADHLVQDLEKELGFRAEAERLRDEIDRARQATVEEKINAALARFESLCGGHKWEQAQREIARLHTLFSEEPRIVNLPSELELRRQEYKRKLLRDYEQSVAVHDVDAAHRLLFELDRYLSSQEAAALKESARSIFKEKLEQMRVEFSLAVSDKRFENAVRVGQRLMREFPNTRYAHEIAELMPVLRQRAAARDGSRRDGAAVGA